MDRGGRANTEARERAKESAMTTQLRKNLIAARALVARGMCIGTDARTKRGRAVRRNSVNAACWCSAGAIRAVTERSGQWGEDVAMYRALGAHIPKRRCVTAWHDAQPTLEAVLSVWDAAIAGTP